MRQAIATPDGKNLSKGIKGELVCGYAWPISIGKRFPRGNAWLRCHTGAA